MSHLLFKKSELYIIENSRPSLVFYSKGKFEQSKVSLYYIKDSIFDEMYKNFNVLNNYSDSIIDKYIKRCTVVKY